MRASVALVAAVLIMFGAAMTAEYAGLVERDTPVATASAEEDAGGATVDGEAVFSSVSEKQLRNGAMGGFVFVCIYVILRHRGVL